MLDVVDLHVFSSKKERKKENIYKGRGVFGRPGPSTCAYGLFDAGRIPVYGYVMKLDELGRIIKLLDAEIVEGAPYDRDDVPFKGSITLETLKTHPLGKWLKENLVAMPEGAINHLCWFVDPLFLWAHYEAFRKNEGIAQITRNEFWDAIRILFPMARSRKDGTRIQIINVRFEQYRSSPTDWELLRNFPYKKKPRTLGGARGHKKEQDDEY